ncbi:MAG: hypothetical protein NTY02_20260 [Acidobacteria bacterium]|nr:hypothetical protein [Acidobacteriota bacterium]
MTGLKCVGLSVSALSLLLACAPATGQVVEKRGQPGSQSTALEKKKYTRGVKGEPAPAPTPRTPAAAPAASLRWEPFAGMDAQIFPSFVVSTATLRLPQEDTEVDDPRQLGEAVGFLGASLEGVPANSRLRVEVKPNRIMDASVFDGQAAAGAGDYEVYPKINYKYDALLDWRQPMPLNITMEVFVDGRSLGTRSETVTVRSINDCPFAIVADEDSDEDDLDLSWMFAAYVNENHPWVDTLTREALDSKIVDAFTGYQDESADEVIRQVYAIWNTLQRRGMRYSDISRSSAESEVVLSQHVRLFDESVTARQANCVDGTVMFAAVLRKIGLEPYLVTVPGHMFLAFDLDEEGTRTLGLETTMMGDTGGADAPRSGKVSKALIARYGGQPSFKSFVAAIEDGTQALAENKSKFDGDDVDYQMISLDESRRMGILPLAYVKK